MSGASWLEELEARLDRTLESFLQANPEQEAMLQEQEARDRQLRLRQERLRLQGQAELERRRLLDLAAEIRRWQERVERARGAGEDGLAARAEAHIQELMEQGRRRWEELGQLGQSFGAVERQLEELSRRPSAEVNRATATARASGAASGAGSGPAAGSGAAGAGGAGSAGAGSAGSASAAPPGPAANPADSLDADWAAFEAGQELQELKRRMGR